jgi:hypothetical protein
MPAMRIRTQPEQESAQTDAWFYQAGAMQAMRRKLDQDLVNAVITSRRGSY